MSPFEMEHTISSIGAGRENDIGELDALVLRVVFHNAKQKPPTLAELADNNLSLLDLYWSKEDVDIDEGDFVEEYSNNSDTMSED